MRILIESIPHAQQRYDTIGDWWWDAEGTLQVRVSNDYMLETEGEQLCVAIHEVVETYLCKAHGVTEESVSDFDKAWIAKHPGYPAPGAEEPGDAPDAPYRREHGFASIIEALIARELGLDGYPVTCVA